MNIDTNAPEFKISGEPNNHSAYRSLTYVDKLFPKLRTRRAATVAMNMDGQIARRYRNAASQIANNPRFAVEEMVEPETIENVEEVNMPQSKIREELLEQMDNNGKFQLKRNPEKGEGKYSLTINLDADEIDSYLDTLTVQKLKD